MKFRLVKLFISFNLTAFWMIIYLFLTTLNQPQAPVSVIPSPPQVQAIFTESGINLPYIRVANSPRLYGLMVGLPTRPQLILSSSLLHQFPEQAMEYVIQHELGHYLLHHAITLFVTWVCCLIAGYFFLRKFALAKPIIIGVTLGLIYLQVGKYNELQADIYAASHMQNPQGMIQAVELFRPQYLNSHPIPTWLDPILYQQTPHDHKIHIAQQENSSRTQAN